jgi:uncharacterized protein DUF4331
MKRFLLLSASLCIIGAATYQIGYASDHDDGEIDGKGRALNLTDHYAFKSPANPDELSLIMYFNPRSQPGEQYFMSTNARYEFHVTRAANKTAAPNVKDDFTFRFEAGAPDATGAQAVTLTMLDKDGNTIGTSTGMTTTIGASKAGQIVTNPATFNGKDAKWFIGPRADSFHFDVVRFFQVRAFLAQRFFGGGGGKGDATASLADNCRGDKFLSVLGNPPTAGEAGGVSDGDLVNLFNPPSCAPDFTKNLNVTAIVLNVKIAALQAAGETVFDTWSTISVAE